MRRYYAPGFIADGRTQRVGTPRPGHGTVYITTEGTGTWVATWVDEFATANANDEAAGVTTFEGSRSEVLAWARAQPAAQRLVPGESNWIPLPENL